MADRLRARLAAKERAREIARQFANYRRKPEGVFKTVSTPREEAGILTVLRVHVLAHSNGTLKLQTNLGAFLATRPEIKSLVSSQIGNSLAQFKGDLGLEFSLI